VLAPGVVYVRVFVLCGAAAWMLVRGTLLRTYAGALYLVVRAVDHRRFSREWLPAVCALCALDLCLARARL